MMYDNWLYGNNDSRLFGVTFMILVMIILVFVLALAIRYLISNNTHTTDKVTTTDILKKRYVRGEMDVKEYQEKHALLD